ncbi:MAG: 1-acyl-sn-glycerol-3-phosphate acyltransferase [Clostridia bacterium]|nr:1-acyl-sn-glycerol-3-phosphate acyltransferase [Clostridia bacterium]
MIFKIIKFLVMVFVRAVFFVKKENYENLPKDGAVILAVNHTSLWDAPIILTSVKRYMRTMGKKELFAHQPLRYILTISGTIPVDRGKADIGAIKSALKTLKDGHVFTIFPSGTRVKDGEADAKSGVALIASKSGAPVVPCKISGGYKLFRRVTVRFGEKMYFESENKKPTADELKAFADKVMKKIEVM